jgi:hypothetical protein
MSCVNVHEGKACFKERMGRCHGMRIEDRLSAFVCDGGGVFGSASEDSHGQVAWGSRWHGGLGRHPIINDKR